MVLQGLKPEPPEASSDDGDDSGDDERGGRLSKNLSSSSLEEIYSKLQIVDSTMGGSIPVNASNI